MISCPKPTTLSQWTYFKSFDLFHFEGMEPLSRPHYPMVKVIKDTTRTEVYLRPCLHLTWFLSEKDSLKHTIYLNQLSDSIAWTNYRLFENTIHSSGDDYHSLFFNFSKKKWKNMNYEVNFEKLKTNLLRKEIWINRQESYYYIATEKDYHQYLQDYSAYSLEDFPPTSHYYQDSVHCQHLFQNDTTLIIYRRFAHHNEDSIVYKSKTKLDIFWWMILSYRAFPASR